MSQRQSKEYNKLIEYYKGRKDQLKALSEEAAKKLARDKAKDDKKGLREEINDLIGNMSTSLDERANAEQKKLHEYEDSSTNIFMELRKAANHPCLRRSLYDTKKLEQMAKLVVKASEPDTRYEYVLEDMTVMSDFELHKLCFVYDVNNEQRNTISF